MKKIIKKYKDNLLMKVLKPALFIVFAFIAVKIGMVGGDMLYSADFSLVRNMDVENFKSTLNYSFPVIDTVYNNGNISFSISREFNNLVKSIFKFDLGDPATVLNAQFPFLYRYYNADYLPSLVAKKDDVSAERTTQEDTDVPEDKTPEPKEDASSISTDEASEKKDFSNDRVVTNGKIVIQNETKYKININELLNEPLKFKFNKSGPKILVYHTHTSESYLSSLGDLNKKGIRNWTNDSRYNVVRVGEELTQNLKKKYGISVIHNGTIHDSNYNKSYVSSLNTINQYVKSYPSIRMTLDLHRDGLGGNKQKLRAVAKVNNKNAAQVMFVIGSSERLSHPKWKENLKLALKLQERLNAIAPGLAKPIYISSNRYNEHVTTGSLIIEIGGDGNLLSECLESTKYIASAINDVVNKSP